MNRQTASNYADIVGGFNDEFPIGRWIAAVVTSIVAHVLLLLIPPSFSSTQSISLDNKYIITLEQNDTAETGAENLPSIPEVSLDKGAIIAPAVDNFISIPEALGIQASEVAAEGLIAANPVNFPSGEGGIQPDLKAANTYPVIDGDEITLAEMLPVYTPELSGGNVKIDDPEQVKLWEIAGLNTSGPALVPPDILEVTAREDKPEDAPKVDETSPSQLGITPTYKKSMRKKLVVGFNKIKPKIEQKQLSGHLRFQFTINREGEIVDAKIKKSSNNKELDRMILNMIKKNGPYPEVPDDYPWNYLKLSYPITINISFN